MTTNADPVAALDALMEAMYRDGCIDPPQTDHSIHVEAYLSNMGYVLVNADMLAPILHDLHITELGSAYAGAAAFRGVPRSEGEDEDREAHLRDARAILAALQDKAVSRG